MITLCSVLLGRLLNWPRNKSGPSSWAADGPLPTDYQPHWNSKYDRQRRIDRAVLGPQDQLNKAFLFYSPRSEDAAGGPSTDTSVGRPVAGWGRWVEGSDKACRQTRASARGLARKHAPPSLGPRRAHRPTRILRLPDDSQIERRQHDRLMCLKVYISGS